MSGASEMVVMTSAAVPATAIGYLSRALQRGQQRIVGHRPREHEVVLGDGVLVLAITPLTASCSEPPGEVKSFWSSIIASAVLDGSS
jgi:hypothetical protein